MAAPNQSKRSRTTAIIAALFCLLVLGLLVHNHYRMRTTLLVESTALSELKAELVENPRNTEVKTRIRQADLALRQQYFQRRRISRRGAWLLLVGALVLIIAMRQAASHRRLPDLARPRSRMPDHQNPVVARSSTAAVGIAFLVGAVSIGVVAGLRLPDQDKLTALIHPAPAPPTDPVATWPRFRGPTGSGIARELTAPTAWDLETGENIRWRVAVPLPGNNSPIIWGDRIFLTGASKASKEVLCFSLAEGELLWRTSFIVPRSGSARNVLPDTGLAASTAVTDGKQVYAMFANGDIGAVDWHGRQAWAINLGVPENMYGHAASLALWQDLLIVQSDQGAGGEERSRLYGLNTATGTIAWEVVRQSPNTWSSPLVIQASGRNQVITCGDPHVIAYAPANGGELWRAELLYGEVVTTPVFVDGLLYIANAGSDAFAIRPNGAGDVTNSHILWKGGFSTPDIVSPLADGKHLLLCVDGLLSCLDAATGKELWEHDLDAMVWASPTLIGEHIYLPTQAGEMIIATIANGYTEVARLPLGEPCVTSPAVVPGALIVRTKDHLLCIGEVAP